MTTNLLNALSLARKSFIALAALFVATTSLAARWTLIDLGTLGGARSFASGINDRGQVVGFADAADGRTHSFLYSDGQMTDLSPLNSETDTADLITTGPSSINNRGIITSGVVSEGIYYPAIYDSLSDQIHVLGWLGGVTWYGFSGVATAVNGRGQAVGYSYLDGLNRHAFIYHNGTMTDLGSFGGYSFALDINDSGIVVGAASDEVNGFMVASMWVRGAIEAICGNTESTSYGINNRGQVVGELLTLDAFHAFVYGDRVVRDLGTLPTGRNSTAYQINNRGQIVGMADVISSIDSFLDPTTGQIYYQTNFEDHAFLYDKGVMVDLNTVIAADIGWVLASAFDINEAGEIVGWGLKSGEWRGYLMTPTRIHPQSLKEPRTHANMQKERRGRSELPKGRDLPHVPERGSSYGQLRYWTRW